MRLNACGHMQASAAVDDDHIHTTREMAPLGVERSYPYQSCVEPAREWSNTKEKVSVAISLVVMGIVMISSCLAARSLHMSTGVAGAWIAPPIADAAGSRRANLRRLCGQRSRHLRSPEAAVSAFTLMKVIGRDVWIGVWPSFYP